MDDRDRGGLIPACLKQHMLVTTLMQHIRSKFVCNNRCVQLDVKGFCNIDVLCKPRRINR
jgi:hypothetical protein